jgi:hypothetical protein
MPCTTPAFDDAGEELDVEDDNVDDDDEDDDEDDDDEADDDTAGSVGEMPRRCMSRACASRLSIAKRRRRAFLLSTGAATPALYAEMIRNYDYKWCER